MLPSNDKPWHNLSAAETVELWAGSQAAGLAASEAEDRLKRYGPNAIATQREQSGLVRFLLQFHQPLIYILIISAVITAFLREWVDSAVISGVVLANALVGYIQESKAVNALAALAKTMTSKATVLRDGARISLDASLVVPGDIIFLESGDKVPADMRILEEQGLQVDESALTGESLPVEKATLPLPAETVLADRRNIVYASTLVTHGQARGIVVATGERTEVGRISRLISSARELETPLTRKITVFSRHLMYAILLLTGVTVIVGLIRGQAPFDMFMAAVALAVGAIPEGLPAAVTITLAIGVGRMAKRQAIIRKLPAVETLGSTTVICSDKTGTLTENKMTVQAIMAGGNIYRVTETGYDPTRGEITFQDRAVDISRHPALASCLETGALCNNSTLVNKEGQWQIQGDPTEGAMLVAAGKGGLPYDVTVQQQNRIDSIPFESEHQLMAVLLATTENSEKKVLVKGSLEVILAACSHQMNADGESGRLNAGVIQEQAEAFASRGLRVLAFAEKMLPGASEEIRFDDVKSGLIFIGLQAMMDPPRPEAAQAVKSCLEAGIRIMMITGDHTLTATAIAKKIGLIPPGEDNAGDSTVISGRELEQLSDRELTEAIARTTVFARTSPEQKLRLVNALQARGDIVAMTGDGVNDAPALKQADIGVAMGLYGTEVAKEAADMVLTDDNFQSIQSAVEEGRRVFDNLTKFIVWTLPTNLGEGLVIMAAIFFGSVLPILPVQILWINMTTAGFLGLMLAFESREPGIMLRPPRDPRQPILTRRLIERIILVGLLLLAGTFLLFNLELKNGATIEQARTVAVNTFIVIELFYLFNCRSLSRSIFSLGLFTNPWVFGGVGIMLLIQLGYTYLPFMNRLFAGAPISAQSWLYIFLTGGAAFVIVEGEKRLRLIWSEAAG
ncbi:MAG: cation-transporting P-type ATPase [Desulfobulbaceae bacterium]|nr:cation-transporting P-type ATPase [Desulfobulbaceae bacterium]